MRTKGRTRKVVSVDTAEPDVQRPGYSSYCYHTLHLDCGHETIRRAPNGAKFKYAECPVFDCRVEGTNRVLALDHLKTTIDGTRNHFANLKKRLANVQAAYRDLKALRQKMYDEGVPDSNEPFAVPIMELEDECDNMIRRANQIKDMCYDLRTRRPEEWK
jgi:hypothetical protein